MMIGSFLFKQRAREALKGNWQNALVVSFFSGVLLTVASLIQTRALEGVTAAAYSLYAMMGSVGGEMNNEQTMQLLDLANRYLAEFNNIAPATWWTLGIAYVLAFVVTPALAVGCNNYFIKLVRGEEIGVFKGLTARMHILPKTLWLYVRMFVQIFLWGLLFILPGIIAAIRYSMAPYYMAENPEISAGEAIRRSDAAMKGRKASYFMLLVSFVGWTLLMSVVQMVLGGVLGNVLMMVLSQFMSLMLTTYINGSCAAFYHALSSTNGLSDLFDTMRRRMKEAGISEVEIRAAGFGEQEDDTFIHEEENEEATEEDDDGGR